MRAGNKRRTAGAIALFFLALLMLSSTVTAIGVAPSKRIFDYRPGETVKYTVDIVNNAHEDLEVILYARGEMSDKVKLSQQMLKLSSTDESSRVDVEFVMPEISKAGQHEIDIVAVGTTPTEQAQGSVVKADLAVVSKLVVDVPYPDLYLEADVHILDTPEGQPVAISIPVFNKGSKEISSLKAEVEIKDSKGATVARAEAESVSLGKGKTAKLTAQTEALQSGEYTATAKVKYDGKETEASTRFNVGELNLQVRSLVVDSFSLGGVAKFDILLYNSWTTDLKNVYAEMQITGQDNKVYSEFKTVATDVAPKGVGRLEGYWYTQDVAPGVYNAKITLHYANKISQKLFQLDVYPDRIVTREVGVTGQAISASEE
ncbi:hypothetical protein KY363_07370, partial [Candidatus Woesearchaeota archaeon]|nr:hypothetical protein [Candidatus Woesearchaeota archaeon]